MWLNDWHDGLRYLAILFSAISLVLLARRLAHSNNEWNTKTRDLWFATVMWCAVGVALPLEGLYEDRPLEPRLVFYFAASAITLKGLVKRDPWGGND